MNRTGYLTLPKCKLVKKLKYYLSVLCCTDTFRSFRPSLSSCVLPCPYTPLSSFAANGGETGRQNRADIQALLGRGQERQRGSVIRGLLVSHAQGDPPASQLGV